MSCRTRSSSALRGYSLEYAVWLRKALDALRGQKHPMEETTMKRLTQVALVGVLLLLIGVSQAAAQARPPAPAAPEPQPVVRLGNFIEVGNDVWMHILATADIRYSTVENRDFERRVRDGATSRNPESTLTQVSESDGNWILLRFGAQFRYQKSLFLHLEFEERKFIDGNTMDDRANCTNPGGTNVFGTAASDENPGFRIQQFYIDYKFIGTPLRIRAGADLWSLDPAGTVGRHDPRLALFGEFGDVDVLAAIVFRREGQRLGYENNSDYIFYTFSAGYNLRPHRFQFDVVYYHDRFTGAQMQTTGLSTDSDKFGWTGQKTDSVLLMPSWTGRMGPVLGLIQGNIVLGNMHGGTLGIPTVAGRPLFAPGRKYDIFAGSVVAYGEVDLGMVRPFLGFFWGSADKDPTDRQLHGFSSWPNRGSSQFTGVPTFAHFDVSSGIGSRDYTCPARLQGTANRSTSSINIGNAVLGTTAGTDCWHDVTYPFNDRPGNLSHLGIATTYSNPGTLMIPVGVKVFPLKGHEITGGYAYRGIVNSKLLEIAFAPELAATGKTHIGKDVYHELWGYWQWTLNPIFDIRLSGTMAFAGDASKDLAHISDCNPALAGTQSCHGGQTALRAEARFRARF